uniref:Protein kinase domain-containing protein n=1 Tax=Colletotrichum fructicola (strain Nara gc5) TaxID=1213859 RepID=L2GDW7_COLFN
MGSIHSVVAKLPQGRNAADAERISSNYVPSEKDTLVSLLAAREPYSQEDLNMMQILLYNDDEPDERYWFYQEGILHPVQLGDQLSDGRYTIINKLGNGSFSTVWLAHDEVLSRKVAINIACAEAQRESDEFPSNEHGILQRLRGNPASHPGAEVIHPCLDTFTMQGPNGRHRYLHSGNLLLALPDEELSKRSVRDLYTSFGLPQQYPVDICKKVSDFDEPIPENAPPYLVGKMYFNDKHAHKLRLSDAKLRISDFGESWRPAEHDRYELNIPEESRAPEALVVEKLRKPIGFPADVWALGCITVELYARYSVFQTYFPGFEEVWAEMVHVLGKPPQTWLDASKADIDSSNNDNGSNPDNETPRHRDPTSLSDHIVQLVDKDRSEKLIGIWEDADEDEKVPSGELRDLLSMLEQIFCWLPEDRIKADDLMNGDWMKNWGLPAIEAMEKAYEEKAQVTKKTSASSGSGSASNTMHHGKTDSPVNETRHGAIRGLFKAARWGLGTGVWLWLERALGI